MNLIRIIVIGLIIFLVIRIIKQWSANKNAQAAIKQSQESKMVRCKVCQLHIPENEALHQDGDFFCSQEHLNNK